MRYLKYAKWTLLGLIALLVVSILHYALPRHDIVQITGTESRMIDFGENSFFWAGAETGMAENTSRSVFFVSATKADGSVVVYRNQDTRWGWPPYFKINTYDIDAQAKKLVQSKDPQWVAVTYYGWRNNFFTIFPNIIAIKPVAGPDVTLIPWVNIIILSALAFVLFMLRRMWMQFRERMVDPAMVRAEQAFDRVDAGVDDMRAGARGIWGRFRAWLDSWKSKPKR